MCMQHQALAFWGEFWDRAGVLNSGECWLPIASDFKSCIYEYSNEHSAIQRENRFS